MIEFEHALFKILLLVSVLSARPPSRTWTPIIIVAGFLLALLPPPFDFPVPWNLLLALTIPLLLWQNARRIIRAQWAGKWKDFLMWVGAALLFAILLLGFKALALPGAFLFGLIAASLIWSAGETVETTSVVSLTGPFTLIFLLAEVEPFIQTPTQYVGGIFSGLFFGALIAFLAVLLALRTALRYRSWITLGQIYLAYGFATLLGVSAVAASLASVIIFATFGLYRGLWPQKKVTPTPLNSWLGFGLVLGLFLLLGWQAHYPPSTLVFFEAIASFGLALVIASIGRYLKLAAFQRDGSLWRIGLRVSLLIFTALLIWPHQTMAQPALLASAFGIAVLNLIVAKLILDYSLEL